EIATGLRGVDLGDVGRRGTVRMRHGQVLEDARTVHDLRGRRIRERHLDDLDAETRRVLILPRIRAPLQFLRRANAGLAGDVDVDVVLVARVLDHRVRVRATARLHVRDVLRVRDVGNVEDS